MRFVVLCASLTLTLVATYGFHRSASEHDVVRMRAAIETTRNLIHNRIETYIAILLATRGLFASETNVGPEQFRAFVDQIDLPHHYPGVQGIGFSLRVRQGEIGSVEQRFRSLGAPDFQVWPNASADEHQPIVMIEPMDRRNHAALGYDMSSEPTRREAMQRACDTGAPAASGKVTLVQEIDQPKQGGFLIYVPVYAGGKAPATLQERRDALIGFVFSPFRMDDLLAGTFGTELHSHVAFEVYDAGVTPEALLHRSAPTTASSTGSYLTYTAIDVAGRRWVVRFAPAEGFIAESGRAMVPFVLASGLLVSLALFGLTRARDRSEETLKLHARMLDTMNEGVSVWDAGGVIAYTNPAQDVMFGYEPDELVGKPTAVLLAGPRVEAEQTVSDVLERLRRSGSWSGEFATSKKDGSTFVTSVRITGLEFSGTPHWLCVQQDITEQKHAEEDRIRLFNLEQTARAEAEAASRSKDEFLAMLGHELRNPLAPIVTALELIRVRGVMGISKELDIIERQLRYVVRLVDDLLDVSRITRGKIVLKKLPLDVTSVVTKAVEIASPLLEQRRSELTIDVPPGLIVEADEVRLAQVLANLLTNAAKFTDAGGRIRLSGARDGDDVVLRVTDNGIGIPRELLPRVFDLFTQGPRRSEGGLGIGLTLVRSLVEKHGGTVSATSEGRGLGSEFVVRLPATSPQENEVELSHGQRPRHRVGRRQNVLVVDDNRDAADTLAELLTAYGHEVRTAHDGLQALAVIPTFKPEIAVLDLGLPVMDGYELAMRLRKLVPVRLIALTGYGQEHDHVKSRASGFEYHLVKPVDPFELLAAIEGKLETPAKA